MDSKGLKVGIISGLISSLVVLIFIQPILSFVWNAFMAIVGSVHHGYVDAIYRNAAVGDRNLVGHMTFMILIGFVLVGMLFFWADLVAPVWSALQSTIKVPVLVFNLVFALMVSVFCVTFLVAFSISSGIMEIDASFTQRLTVLAPAVSDAEYKTLKARWAGMRGKADYDALVTAMDSRAAELGVTLPPVRKP